MNNGLADAVGLPATQLKNDNISLKNHYIKSKVNNVTVNNANIISGVFDALNTGQNNQLQDQNFAPKPQIDMESAAVSLGTNNNIVNPDTTSLVFGTPLSSENIMPTPGETVNANLNTDALTNNNSVVETVPYIDPVINSTNTSNREVNSQDDYIKYFNEVRNKITNFYNDINMELDKFQEQIIQKSGVSLVDNSLNNTVPTNANLVQNDFSMNINDNIFNQQQEQTFPLSDVDLDKTMVIPGNVMSEAISGMSRAA